MSRVSIIIPCHNDGVYLSESVGSAKAQTHHDCEIIIVDDHSSDSATLAVLTDLKKQGHAVFHLPEGMTNPSSARNFGIEHASGEYILPLDADDRIAPSYAAKAAAILDAQPEIDICYCEAAYFGLKKGTWKLPEYSFPLLLLRNMIFISAIFRKKSWERAGGFDQALENGYEDHLFWLKLAAMRGGVFRIPETLFFYRIRKYSRIAAIRKKGVSEKDLAMERFRRAREIYAENLETLYESCVSLESEKNQLKTLFSWRLCQPLFAVEYRLKNFAKRILGR